MDICKNSKKPDERSFSLVPTPVSLQKDYPYIKHMTDSYIFSGIKQALPVTAIIIVLFIILVGFKIPFYISAAIFIATIIIYGKIASKGIKDAICFFDVAELKRDMKNLFSYNHDSLDETRWSYLKQEYDRIRARCVPTKNISISNEMIKLKKRNIKLEITVTGKNSADIYGPKPMINSFFNTATLPCQRAIEYYAVAIELIQKEQYEKAQQFIEKAYHFSDHSLIHFTKGILHLHLDEKGKRYGDLFSIENDIAGIDSIACSIKTKLVFYKAMSLDAKLHALNPIQLLFLNKVFQEAYAMTMEMDESMKNQEIQNRHHVEALFYQGRPLWNSIQYNYDNEPLYKTPGSFEYGIIEGKREEIVERIGSYLRYDSCDSRFYRLRRSTRDDMIHIENFHRYDDYENKYLIARVEEDAYIALVKSVPCTIALEKHERITFVEDEEYSAEIN